MRRRKGRLPVRSGRIEGVVRYIFYILLCFSFLYLAVCLQKMPSERLENRQCDELNAKWYRILSDGSLVPISVPGKCDAEWGEEVVITTTLPEDVYEDAVLCFRTSKQEMDIYIDGQKRMSYSTKDTRMFGKTSISIYMLVPLSVSDSGKEIRVHFSTNSSYAGVIRPVYYSDVFGVWNKLIGENVPLLFYAVIMIVFSLISIVISIVLHILSKKRFYLDFLGWAVLIIAVWLLCQSPLRQLYFENVSLASSMAHLMLLLVLLPISIYINSVQGFRYNKFYMTVSLAALADWVFCITMIVANIFEYSEIQYINLSLYGVIILGVIVTMLLDNKKGYVKEYSLIAYGLIGLVASAALQIAESFRRDVVMNGGFICLGVVLMVVTAIVATIQQFVRVQKEQLELQDEVNRKELKIENLTYQAMVTLAHTIDAKDAYTNGHSVRVAEYARLIAQRAGKDETQQIEIYFMGLLHDIGKIGIKDEIINKPGKLTEEEFAIIKSHSTIGFDILKSMTEINNIEYGARWHHERYDGCGYPDGIKGEDIPEYARIIAIADSYDAMSSNRSYRKALPQEKVREEIVNGKGKQFDPVLADIMLQLIDEDVNYDMRQKD